MAVPPTPVQPAMQTPAAQCRKSYGRIVSEALIATPSVGSPLGHFRGHIS